ncbi:hypothetical protein SAMN04489724_4763 [Algoriphagus locisalis]|uniref:Uncharacterized protein n=1 Tax=Algoriphagus locisalis TaxID=305507 RepID=A0A1I7E2C2_9BACT|nr:hypothetical protein SAMN04489724_4763 [Algoriphagus locisalis]
MNIVRMKKTKLKNGKEVIIPLKNQVVNQPNRCQLV